MMPASNASTEERGVIHGMIDDSQQGSAVGKDRYGRETRGKSKVQYLYSHCTRQIRRSTWLLAMTEW
jgi:hypothetical protein